MTAFQDWLDSDTAIRCTLIKIQNVWDGTANQTIYLSSKNFVSDSVGLSAEIPANQPFLPIISNSIEYTEKLSVDGQASLSYGDIAINNTNGEYDAWINYVWATRPISVYIGDVNKATSTYTKIFNGTVADIAFSDRNSINIRIGDILQRLNTPITDKLLGGALGTVLSYGGRGTDNQNNAMLRPLVFGEVHNITPLMIDSTTLEYMVHDGRIESIIEVRDNGIPVQFTASLTSGTFVLVRPPAGVITCSVQGDKPVTGLITGYNNTVAKIIQRIITTYGKSSDVILSTELDTVNLAAFDTVNQQPVGIYISDRTNVISVCQELAASVGAQFTATRMGLISLLKLDIPVLPDTYVTITDGEIIQGSCSIAQKLDVKASVKLGYCKNWTVQTNLVTGIPTSHRDLFALDYYVKSSIDSAVQALYKLSADDTQTNTLLLSDTGGAITAETIRLLNLRKVSRFIYTMNCTQSLLSIALGDIVKLIHYRFGLAAGKTGQVVSVSINWDTGTTQLEVFV